MPGLVRPHGGVDLKPLLLAGDALAAELDRARGLPKLRVTSREKGDIIMLGMGGFTPLTGFMTYADWRGVCDGYRTANGLFWPIPITLSAQKTAADEIDIGSDIALIDPDSDDVLATMSVRERYTIDKSHECATVFRTTDGEHPGVKMLRGSLTFSIWRPPSLSRVNALFTAQSSSVRARALIVGRSRWPC